MSKVFGFHLALLSGTGTDNPSRMEAPDLLESPAPLAGHIHPFPPEIEYEIFVMAFHQDPKQKFNLLLVSKRLSEWYMRLPFRIGFVTFDIAGHPSRLILVIYKAITFGFAAKYGHPNLEQLQRHGHLVKHLFLCGSTYGNTSSEDEIMILQLCPNVTNLALWHGLHMSYPNELFDLSLTQLSVHTFSDEFATQVRTLRTSDKGKYRKWCDGLTHIAWGAASISAGHLISSFPNLTHCLLGDWETDIPMLVEYILKGCPGLEVLVILLSTLQNLEEFSVVDESVEGREFGDIRVVILEAFYVKYWIDGTKGQDDLWRIAERTIRERRKVKRVPVNV